MPAAHAPARPRNTCPSCTATLHPTGPGTIHASAVRSANANAERRCWRST